MAAEDKRYWQIYFPVPLIERCKAAIANTRHLPGEAANHSELIQRVLVPELERLEAQYNGGREWEAVDRLPPGPRAGYGAGIPRAKPAEPPAKKASPAKKAVAKKAAKKTGGNRRAQ